ncbi:ankyrin repeat domain-containing protein [Bacteroidota bacterium]
MKKQKINSIKVVTRVTLAVTLLAFAACSSKQENTTVENGQDKVSKTSIKPPNMDIHTATLMGNLEAIKQHIKAGSDLNIKEPAVGSTPLITAAVFGKTEIAKALIEAGADVNYKNNQGSTALHSASFLCRTEIVESLLNNGADKNIKNNFGSTALESVAAPFNIVKAIYDQFNKDLGPMGLKLDYEKIEKTRPRIAEMLR